MPGWRRAGRPRLRLRATAATDAPTLNLIARVIAAEISVAIKGHGLVDDARQYVQAARKLSAFHGALLPADRAYVYEVFREYVRIMADENQVLDADDVAITLLGHLRTPLWLLRQRQGEGYDFVFVDEAQLFNDNERRLFPLLTAGDKHHVPIALALDEAQDLRAGVSAGLGLLGIEAVHEERLATVHRSEQSILDLAFAVIQRTTNLFHAEFPDFTRATCGRARSRRGWPSRPTLVTVREHETLGAMVVSVIRKLRKGNVWSIGVVVHAEQYWAEVTSWLSRPEDFAHRVWVVTQRGDDLDLRTRWLVVSRPEHVGGQEFDAVVAVGLERGVVPPRVPAQSHALGAALEEWALREMYLSFTRARSALVVVNGPRSEHSHLLQDAVKGRLLSIEGAGR